MGAKIMANKLKENVDELSSSSTSSSKRIKKLKISVLSTKKATNTIISKPRPLSKKWRSSEDSGVQGGCTPDEESVLNVKVEDAGTEGVPGDNSWDKKGVGQRCEGKYD